MVSASADDRAAPSFADELIGVLTVLAQPQISEVVGLGLGRPRASGQPPQVVSGLRVPTGGTVATLLLAGQRGVELAVLAQALSNGTVRRMRDSLRVLVNKALDGDVRSFKAAWLDDLGVACDLPPEVVRTLRTAYGRPGDLNPDRVDRVVRRLLIKYPRPLASQDGAATGADTRESEAPAELSRYLAATLAMARDHPAYSRVDDESAVPPLASIYRGRQAARLPDRGQVGRIADLQRTFAVLSPSPAEEILLQADTCVIVGGPGYGKSSLLRMGIAFAVERWLAGQADVALPVLVPALTIAEPFPMPEVIAKAATAGLSTFGLLEELPPRFFREPPVPGLPWLVLVDGLDEIADAALRRAVLAKLAAISAGEHRSLYRFVVAARSLSDGELGVLGDNVTAYQLLPFTRDDLRQVAAGWFQALGLPDPDRAAGRFIKALAHAHLDELARIPLMIAMLCQMHAASPGRPLPASRIEIYDQFTDMLHERQHAAGLSGIRPQARAAMARFGDDAVAQADRTLDYLADLIAGLAAEWQAGNPQSAVGIVASLPDAGRPRSVPAGEWRGFLAASLQRSGVLTGAPDALTFVHQSVLEYFAARHATRDPQARAQTFHRLFGASRAGRSRGRRAWDPLLAREEASEVGFLLGFLLKDANETGADTIQAVQHMIAEGGLGACRFLAEHVRLGTFPMDDAVVHRLKDGLEAIAVGTGTAADRIEAAGLLAELGGGQYGERGCKALMVVACDPAVKRDKSDEYSAWAYCHVSAEHPRVAAARIAAEHSYKRGAETLASMVRDTGFDPPARASAAEALDRLDDADAPDALHVVASDPGVGLDNRVEAARRLVQRGDTRGGDALASVAADVGDPRARASGAGWIRVDAAKILTGIGDPRGPELLAKLTFDTTLDVTDRSRAIEALVLGGERNLRFLDADALYTLALDTTQVTHTRRFAAAALARLNDDRRFELLAAMAQDPTLTLSGRVDAATILAGLGDERGPHLLTALADDSSLDNSDLVDVAEALAFIGHERGAELIDTILSRRSTLDPKTYMRAVIVLREIKRDAARAAGEAGPNSGVPTETTQSLLKDPDLDF